MNSIEHKIYTIVNHYDEDKYWTLRKKVINPEEKTHKLIKMYWLLKLKKMESYNNASIGTYINYGAIFKGKPILPHGLRGIFISDKAKIGENCTLYQQIVIGVLGTEKNVDGAPIIGDNCLLGAGCKIIGPINIGNNVKIGANCVVNFDVPDNATVVCTKSRIILE